MEKLSKELIKVILSVHNEKRNKIAGGNLSPYKPACRMATMTWGEELARVAAFNVKQCKMKHDLCRSTTDYKYSGQNLAMYQTTGNVNLTKQIIHGIESWFDEYKNANMEQIRSYPSGPLSK